MPTAPAYIDSWYTETARGIQPWPRLEKEERADVCVIGGGYTGLSAAIHLAERGYSVVLLEAERIGWGASGRNGGHCSLGQRQPQETLEQWVGKTEALRLWNLGLEAVETVRDLVRRFNIECDLGRGNLQVAAKRSDAEWYRAHVRHMQNEYGLDCRFIEGDELVHLSGSTAFRGGLLEYQSAHLHPLNYALGLAEGASSLGVRLYEDSRVTGYDRLQPTRVSTVRGNVIADYVVLACNAYLGKLEPRIAGRIMPLNNFILATEALGEAQQRQLNPENLCMYDAKFVVNYWKLTRDGRMLFGGGENYTRRFPADIRSFVRRHLLALYPQLAAARIDHAWGGTLAVTMNRMPCFGRLEPNLFYALGYSGHGVQTASLGGKLIAEAMAGTAERFDVMARLRSRPFPGGTLLRWPGLVAGMLYHVLRDKLGD